MATTEQGVAVNIAALANDVDSDPGDQIAIVAAEQPGHGTVVVIDNRTIRYKPNLDFYGSDQFSYTISDQAGALDSAVVRVTVLRINRAPVAVDDSAATDEGVATSISVLLNDTDPDDDPLVVIGASQGISGSVTIQADNTIAYSPSQYFYGEDTFTYSVSDGQGGTAVALVQVTVAPNNAPPEPVADAVIIPLPRFAQGNVQKAGSASVLISPLANDIERYGRTLQIQSLEQPAHGQATLLTNNQIQYTPLVDFSGTDMLSYQVGIEGASPANGVIGEVYFIVHPQPGSVTANPDEAQTLEDTSVSIDVLGNDQKSGTIGSLSILTVSAQLGRTSIDSDGAIRYFPPLNFYGNDTLSYVVGDGALGADETTVTITVTATNDAPVARPDGATTLEDFPVSIQVLTNDSDVDGDSLSVVSVDQGKLGIVTIGGNGEINYQPLPDRFGADRFAYTIEDGQGGSSKSVVEVVITAQNDPPTAADDRVVMDGGSQLVIPVKANDSDVDGDPIFVLSVSLPQHGTVLIDENDMLVYTPKPGFRGNDQFGYALSDGSLISSAQVIIFVRAVESKIFLPMVKR